MYMIAVRASSFDSFIQLLGVLLIFIFVLGLTYVTTRWVAGYQKAHSFNRNLRVIETLRLTTNKYIQIVEAGDEYLVIALGKDEVRLLTKLTEEQLKEIKDLPLYFIYSKDDNIVDPTKHEQPTIDRLKKLGASNLHVATTENVTDTSGRFKQEDGSPYAYMGHFSWVHFFNNESVCDEHQEGAWQWMADLVKK